MSSGEILVGLHRSWNLVKKLGEGDAGEVFLVESLIDQKTGVLKRPRQNAYTTDILRQATQIGNEGKILSALYRFYPNKSSSQSPEQLNYHQKIEFCVPALLDRSPVGTEYSERMFIVTDEASGINLNTLARYIHNPEFTKTNLPFELNLLIETFQRAQKIPDLLILRILEGLLDFLNQIHCYSCNFPDLDVAGFLWNDIKVDHLYWDIHKNRIMVIDWGNGQPIDSSGTSIDKRYSIKTDYKQFLDVMGSFLEENNASLYLKLNWSQAVLTESKNNPEMQELHEAILQQLEYEQQQSHNLRSDEESLLFSSEPTWGLWQQLNQVQNKLLMLGELPNWKDAHHLANQLARQLVISGDRKTFHDVVDQVCRLPGEQNERWKLVQRIAHVIAWPGLFPLPAQQALLASLSDDWAEALWQLRLSVEGVELPPWWQEITEGIRKFLPETSGQLLTPLVVLNRLIHTLQAQLLANPVNSPLDIEDRSADDTLLRSLKIISKRWVEYEPSPPHSGIEYTEIENLKSSILAALPSNAGNLEKVLEQPRAIVQIIMDAWNRQDYISARRGLRRLLLWDPDRQRVFLADRMISSAPQWLEQIRKGPENGESLLAFVTRCELHGREMRNLVGKAEWLNNILEAFLSLRKGASPSDILINYPDLRTEAAWLRNYHPPQLIITKGPIVIARSIQSPETKRILKSSRKGKLGRSAQIWLREPLDTWAPETRGSSARVFMGVILDDDNHEQTAAIKLMRPDKTDYALPLFREEAEILLLMKDVPGICYPLEFGFIKTDQGNPIPSDERSIVADDLTGEVFRIPADEIQSFLKELNSLTLTGWLPYFALKKYPRENNLLMFCDPMQTGGKFLILKEGLRMSIQILDILQEAHARNIVYRDHKIIHYYWLPEENGITIIDWNVAKRIPEGLTSAERKFDIVQFGARAFHHIMTGRPAQGALPLGPTRPEEIEQAASSYQAQWTFDDLRLPTHLKELIERTLAGEFEQVAPLRKELEALFYELPEES